MTPQMFKRPNVQTLTLAALLTYLLTASTLCAQSYFPPKDSDVWETVSLDELGWCAEPLDSLLSYVERNDSRAFIVLKDGRIAIEWYADGFERTDNWYWASAGKTVTATLVGILQEQGVINTALPSRTYLGNGWSSLTDAQESAITVWHHLTMTTGLDDRVADPHCTTADCLVYKADPGTRWAYHNAPYTLLDGVIEGASGRTLNAQYTSLLSAPIGMGGGFIKQGYNNVLITTPRAMARFGLLALNGFVWDGDTILRDRVYVKAMTETSQDLNLSYGYLWWLNGKSSFMLPGLQVVFPGSLTPNAPPDAYYGLGKNDQIVCVVPSEDLVVIRMGDPATPDGPDVPTQFGNELWALLREVMCTPTSVQSREQQGERSDELQATRYDVYDMQGRRILSVVNRTEVAHAGLRSGLYILQDPTTGQVDKWVIW